jgi:TP901 family phage tail tape measure protein
MGVRTIGYRFTGDYRDLDAALDHLDQRIQTSVTGAERASKASGVASTAAAKGVAGAVTQSAASVEQATARVAVADGRASAAAETYARAQKTAADAAKASAAAQERAALAAQAAQAKTGTAAEIAAAKQAAAAEAATARVLRAQAATAAGAEVAARREVAAIERATREETAARAKGAAEAKRAERDLEQAADKRRRASTEIGQNLLTVGAATAIGIGVAVKAFADFDSAMSRAAAGTDATAAQLMQLRQAAIDAGAATQYSATEAADGITALGKAGISVNDILGGALKGSLDLAAAGQLDVANAAEIAATAMTQFGLSGEQIPHVADLLAAGAGKAQGDVTDLANALKYVGPVAASANIPLEQTVGTLAELASQGILGEQAGTSTRGFLLSLTSPSQLAQQTLHELGVELYDTQGRFVGFNGATEQLRTALDGMSEAQRNAALGAIFGNEQITAATILYQGGAAAVDEWTGKVNDAGFASRQAATLTDNLAGDLERLKGSASTVFIQSGSGTNDGLRSLTKTVTGLINAYGDLPPVVQHDVVLFGALAAASALLGGGLLVLLPRIAATKVALVELGVSGAGARASLLAVSRVAAVAGVAVAGIEFNRYIAGAQVAEVSSAGLQKSLLGLAQNGQLGGDALHLLSNGMGPFRKDAKDSSEALARFAENADAAFGQDFGDKIGRLGTFGAVSQQARAQIEQIDGALAGLAQNGHAAEAAKAFETLLARAGQQGADVNKLRSQFTQYNAVVESAGQASTKTAGGVGQLGGSMDAAATQAQQLANAIAEAEKAAEGDAFKAFSADTDVLGSFDAAGTDDKAAAAADRLTKARQRLSDVEERIASRRKGASVADEQALTRAREAVDVAEKAARAASGNSLAKTYRDTIREASQFTDDISTALAKGLDPHYVEKLLEEGPKQAGPILRELVSDHSGRLIDMVNSSEKKLARLGALAVEQARLTARAIASDTDQMTTDLARATQIASQQSQAAGKATAESIGRSLKLAPGEVERIASEFGITLKRSTEAELAKRAVTVTAKAQLEVELSGNKAAIEHLEDVKHAQDELETKKSLSLEVLGTKAAVEHYEDVHYAAGQLKNKTVDVKTTGTGKAVSQTKEVRDALSQLRNKTVTVTVNTRNSAQDVYGSGGGHYEGSIFVPDRKADGGQVLSPRGGAPRADDLLTLLSHREWVHPVASVDFYGAEFMRAVQHQQLPKSVAQTMLGQLPGYADGGQRLRDGVSSTSRATSAASTTVSVLNRPAQPVVVRVPVAETRTREVHLNGDVVLQRTNPDTFEDWAIALGASASERYS